MACGGCGSGGAPVRVERLVIKSPARPPKARPLNPRIASAMKPAPANDLDRHRA